MGVGRDYKKRGNRRHKSSKKQAPTTTGLPAWVWFFAGIIVMAVLFFMMDKRAATPDVKSAESSTSMQAQTPSQPAEKSKESPKAQPPADLIKPMPEVPDYGFYEELPESEVKLENIQIQRTREEKRRADERKKAAQQKAEDQQYVLQVGSFKAQSDAEARKAELAMLGLTTQVRSAQVDGAMWHRVYVGPAQGKTALHQLREQLKDLGVEFLVVPVK